MPSEYFQSASCRGKVEAFRYASKDYTQSGRPPTDKIAYVYLPPGYDKNGQYDVIYLLHGWTGVAEEYFARPGTPQLRNLLDNLIARGKCRPFIAVSPTWDKDNRPKDWGTSVREIAAFAHEYENDLLPAVEKRYATYAKTTDHAGLVESRDHRAVGGFSLGAVTTWNIFEHCFDLQRFYLPMSGDSWHVEMFGGASRPRETADFLAEIVRASRFDNAFHVWHAVGTRDVRGAQTHNLAQELMKRGEFPAENYSYHQKQGGYHDFNAVWEFCWNALPEFFPPVTASKDSSLK